MAGGWQSLDRFVQPAGVGGLYMVERRHLDPLALGWYVDGRRVTAAAAHPVSDELLYLTTSHPAALAHLPDDYWELD
ncbi:MAG: hypothetical protein AB7Q17_08355 [Phycisphaerae bacterium]